MTTRRKKPRDGDGLLDVTDSRPWRVDALNHRFEQFLIQSPEHFWRDLCRGKSVDPEPDVRKIGLREIVCSVESAYQESATLMGGATKKKLSKRSYVNRLEKARKALAALSEVDPNAVLLPVDLLSKSEKDDERVQEDMDCQHHVSQKFSEMEALLAKLVDVGRTGSNRYAKNDMPRALAASTLLSLVDTIFDGTNSSDRKLKNDIIEAAWLDTGLAVGGDGHRLSLVKYLRQLSKFGKFGG
jgi:hypothetical protein